MSTPPESAFLQADFPKVSEKVTVRVRVGLIIIRESEQQ